MAVEITFFRRGHANNSSSTHSLIFASEDNILSDDNHGDYYGWEQFVISSPQKKFEYFILAAYYAFQKTVAVECSDWWMTYKNDFDAYLFEGFVHMLYKTNPPWDVSKIGELIAEGSIDHQSVMAFPTYRNPLRGLNREFLKAWMREICENNYMILGGNDNSDDEEQNLNRDRDLSGEKNDFKRLYKFLCDKPLPMCEFDVKTGEYVLSCQHEGSLMKLKFSH